MSRPYGSKNKPKEVTPIIVTKSATGREVTRTPVKPQPQPQPQPQPLPPNKPSVQRIDLDEAYNIQGQLEDGYRLVLIIDTRKDGGQSSSGKSTIIASTRGNVKLGGGLRLGINLYKV